MNLFFDSTELLQRGRGLTFDDVLLVPCRSDVRSRREPSLATRLTRTRTLELPILSANMDTVTELEMARAMRALGGLGLLHRFLAPADQARMVAALKAEGHELIGASVGVTDDEKGRADLLVAAGANLITIDIAHGHSVQMLEMMAWLKKAHPKVELIVGNLATPEAAEDLIAAGADALKVGIGPGSMCTTRLITGCGVPQLTAIALCAQVARRHGVPVIADGGLRTSGDLMKAFAAGADVVMLGGMLSGTIETPGEIKNGRKQYRGMASRAAQDSWRGGVPEGMAPEGESTSVAIKGHVKDVLSEVAGGLRSGMSYLNASALPEIRERARFIEMSPQGMGESRAHGVVTS